MIDISHVYSSKVVTFSLGGIVFIKEHCKKGIHNKYLIQRDQATTIGIGSVNRHQEKKGT